MTQIIVWQKILLEDFFGDLLDQKSQKMLMLGIFSHNSRVFVIGPFVFEGSFTVTRRIYDLQCWVLFHFSLTSKK